MGRSNDTTVVTERGQVSIPAPLRRDLALRPGTHLRWEAVGPGEMRVVTVEDGPAVGAVAMLGFARRFRQPRRTATWMRELRNGER